MHKDIAKGFRRTDGTFKKKGAKPFGSRGGNTTAKLTEHCRMGAKKIKKKAKQLRIF